MWSLFHSASCRYSRPGPEVRYPLGISAGPSENVEHGAMHLGIFSYNVEYGARSDALARACEALGGG